ncbi:MAG: ABC transporter ATP-binding protein [Clostridiaceae bacterium]|nr:ABC transporter ATP-binding protein [Clostridiaceae bacterium]
MKAENAIEVHDITKKFRVYLDKGRTLKELALFSKRRKYEERNVLSGISFEVKKGEAIGLIGHNGCGKSTTLKLLTRIMYPDSGTIEMRGRVSSLIELGAGFHPDMSGRQNIYTNASIFGLTRKEIDARLEKIIEFSELRDFIDNPVRTYSSGMYMRLAFAVAINVDADILLIDEILAVGDANFQAKCFNKLKQIKAEGTTIVIVSHGLGQIEEFCERTIWIHDGKIQEEGNPRDVHPHYMSYMGQLRQDTNPAPVELAKTNERSGSGLVRIKEVESLVKSENGRNLYKTGDQVTIRISYEVKQKVEDVAFGFEIRNAEGVKCYATNSRVDYAERIDLDEDGSIDLKFSSVLLIPGKYKMDLSITTVDGFPVDNFQEAFEFEMYSEIKDKGISRLVHQWEKE